MTKEIIINGVTYVKKEEPKKVQKHTNIEECQKAIDALYRSFSFKESNKGILYWSGVIDSIEEEILEEESRNES